MPAIVPEKNLGAPKVKLERSGRRVRLRNLDYALEGCLSSRGREVRFSISPNVWTEVPEEVYVMLRNKFDKPSSVQVTDWNGNPDNPQRYTRQESTNSYTIEFPDEYNKER